MFVKANAVRQRRIGHRITDTTRDLPLMISLIHVTSAVTWGYFLSSFAFPGSTDNIGASLHFYSFTHHSI